MKTKIQFALAPTLVAIALTCGTVPLVTSLPAAASELDGYLGAAAPGFDSPETAVAAFKTTLASGNLDDLAKLLGLDPAKLKAYEGITDIFKQIQEGTAKSVQIQDDADRKILQIGDKLWPFPFPLAKDKDGKWAFDTKAGLEEVVNRRVGQNENEVIDTMREYVDAQKDYASDDRDGDGVLEYAQKLISTPGKTDGLYWPIEQGDGDSPAGAFVNEEQLTKAGKEDDGYFGYHFRILRGQGNNIAGGRYDYVINGNMIAGFALIAWPARYARTGVYTFEVNHAGIVYQKDLGPDTDAVVQTIRRFNPDKTWEEVKG
jgi:hypothetical protein